MDLFEEQRQQNRISAAPLPVRMRPRTLDEFAGQQHFVGEGGLLRRMLEGDQLSSCLFYGPAGTGKTSLAMIVAELTHAVFKTEHAAELTVASLRKTLNEARERLEVGGQRTVLFLDEIHRFNRAQQDVLLRDVEDGTIILIGATTENPFFTVTAPLVSRCQIFQFEPLSVQDVIALMQRAVADEKRGFGKARVELTSEAATHLATVCDGDARRALLALEVAVRSELDRLRRVAGKAKNGKVVIDLDAAASSIQRKPIVYDRSGDFHYDAASAFIKSIRGSDPDAAIYWLARMLEAGEDPRFIARRVVIAAAEDIGNADPMGLVVAQAAADATNFVGLPECQLVLAQAVVYLACAPKSNASAMAIWQAGEDVKKGRIIPVPRHLRSTAYKSAAKLGHGDGYKYPHSHPEGIVAQEYLGVEKVYYIPTDRGAEAEWGRRLQEWREKIRREGNSKSASLEE